MQKRDSETIKRGGKSKEKEKQCKNARGSEAQCLRQLVQKLVRERGKMQVEKGGEEI